MSAWNEARYAGRIAGQNHTRTSKGGPFDGLTESQLLKYHNWDYKEYQFDDANRICFYCKNKPSSTIRVSTLPQVGPIYYCNSCAGRHNELKKEIG